jgi:hypothetical protein
MLVGAEAGIAAVAVVGVVWLVTFAVAVVDGIDRHEK